MERRGNETGIYNPNHKTLDHHNQHRQFNEDSNSDPDPAQRTSTPLASASNSRPPPPPPLPPQEPQSTTSAPDSAALVRYRECLKNHAASMGAHVVDGCGEFMPGGVEGTQEALKCAACECHRNFHRREVNGECQPGGNSYYNYNPHPNNIQRSTFYPTPAPAPAPAPLPPPQQYRYSHGPSTGPNPNPPIMMAFGRGGGAPAESSSEDLNMFHSNAGAQAGVQPSFTGSKKRFRTKFSREQKDRMQEVAEKLGWKMQKQDEEEVQQFCNDLGLKRQVFKVWLHNNKQAMKKKQL